MSLLYAYQTATGCPSAGLQCVQMHEQVITVAVQQVVPIIQQC